jgi:hypothetical protein
MRPQSCHLSQCRSAAPDSRLVLDGCLCVLQSATVNSDVNTGHQQQPAPRRLLPPLHARPRHRMLRVGYPNPARPRACSAAVTLTTTLSMAPGCSAPSTWINAMPRAGRPCSAADASASTDALSSWPPATPVKLVSAGASMTRLSGPCARRAALVHWPAALRRCSHPGAHGGDRGRLAHQVERPLRAARSTHPWLLRTAPLQSPWRSWLKIPPLTRAAATASGLGAIIAPWVRLVFQMPAENTHATCSDTAGDLQCHDISY